MKKYIAPIIIAAILVLYFVLYAVFIVFIPINIFIKIAILVIPVGLCIAMIYALIQRINEIKKGEDDDISKY